MLRESGELYPLIQAGLAVKRRAGGNSGLQDQLSSAVDATSIRVAAILASRVDLALDTHMNRSVHFAALCLFLSIFLSPPVCDNHL